MKRKLLLGGMALFFHLATFSQNSNSQLSKGSTLNNSNNVAPSTVQPIQTQEEKNVKALADTPQGKNNLLLGLPVTASQEEYNAAKKKLYLENPDKYNELFKQKKSETTPSNGVRNVQRSTYNDMPAERKAYIDAHPELYKIID